MTNAEGPSVGADSVAIPRRTLEGKRVVNVDRGSAVEDDGVISSPGETDDHEAQPHGKSTLAAAASVKSGPTKSGPRLSVEPRRAPARNAPAEGHDSETTSRRAGRAAAGFVAGAFGIVGAFIQVLDEREKIFNMFAAIAILVLAGVGYMWWRHSRTHPRRIVSVIVAVVVIVLVGFVAGVPNRRDTVTSAPGAVWPGGATAPPAARAAPDPASSDAAPGQDPRRDQYEHEIWPSSLDNQTVDLPERGWAMTDFVVTLPYLRSIEIAAAPDGKRVLLGVYNAHGDEVASGEPAIVGYRAKFVFEQLKDVSADMGGRLYLRIDNIYPGPLRVYFTKNDAQPGITSYLPCGRQAVYCPNPAARDLVALIVGRQTS